MLIGRYLDQDIAGALAPFSIPWGLNSPKLVKNEVLSVDMSENKRMESTMGCKRLCCFDSIVYILLLNFKGISFMMQTIYLYN